MAKNFFIYLTLLISLIITIKCQQTKLTKYIGIGYDVAIGNPNTDRIDPGFRVAIFNLTYNQDQFTGDNMYKIPDGSFSLNKQSCSFTQTSNEYTGNLSY